MTDESGGLYLSIGRSRSGKTYGMKEAVFDDVRQRQILVIDRMREWNSVPTWLLAHTVGASSLEHAVAALKGGARFAIVRERGDLTALLEGACKWAAESRMPSGVVMSEAHRAIPNGCTLPEYVDACVTAWAHHGTKLYLDTQRLARLETTCIEQATVLKIYAVHGPRDRYVIRSTWGRELEEAVEQCAAKFDAGQRGWHVNVLEGKPYKIVRG